MSPFLALGFSSVCFLELHSLQLRIRWYEGSGRTRVFQKPPALLGPPAWLSLCPVYLCLPGGLASIPRGLLDFDLGKDHGPTPMGI